MLNTADVANKIRESQGAQAPEGGAATAEPQKTTHTPEAQAPEPQPSTQQPTQESQSQEPQKPKIDFDYLKESFGVEVESEDQLKSIFENHNKVSEYETRLQEYEKNRPYYDELEQTFQQLVEQNDPLKAFGGDADAYKRYSAARELSANRDESVVSRVLGTDINQLSDIEVINLNEQFNAKSLAGRDDLVKRSVYSDLGVDFDRYQEENEKPFDVNNPQLNDVQQTKLARMASQARNQLQGELNKVMSGIEVPESKNIKEDIQSKVQSKQEAQDKLKTGWQDSGKKLSENLKELEFNKTDKEGNKLFEYKHKVEGDFLKKAPEMALRYAMQNGLEPTEENLNKVAGFIRNAYISEHASDIMNAAIQEAVSRKTEELDQDIHNGQPLNKSEAPPQPSTDGSAQVNSYFARKFGNN